MAITSQRKSRVTVQATLTVVSSTPVEPGRSYKLTPLDHAMKHHTLHVVYYYKAGSSAAADANSNDATFGRLRVSLCELLCHYPAITGRLSPDEAGNWRVRFTDAGVRTLRAKVATTLDEWMRSADLEEEMDLTVMDEMPEETQIWSPFRIQMNEFECGGLALGLSCNHLLADPTTISLFINSWAQFHRGDSITHPPFIPPSPLLLRPSLLANKPPASHHHYFKNDTLLLPNSGKLATATFSFSDRVIRENLLIKVQTHCFDASPFDLLIALFWSRILDLTTTAAAAANGVVRANGNHHPPQHYTSKKYQTLSICVDFRKQFDKPLPYGYFGNALLFSNLTLDDNNNNNNGDFVRMVETIHHHLAGLKEEKFWAMMDWLEKTKNDDEKAFQIMYGSELTCINMEDLTGPTEKELGGVELEPKPMLYASAFEKAGKEKPIHVSYNVGGNVGAVEGLIFILPSPEGGMARRVKVVLSEELVGKLCDDHVIRSLEPSIFLNGGGI